MVTIVNLQKAPHKKKRLLKATINVERAKVATELNLPKVSGEHNFEPSKGILWK